MITADEIKVIIKNTQSNLTKCLCGSKINVISRNYGYIGECLNCSFNVDIDHLWFMLRINNLHLICMADENGDMHGDDVFLNGFIKNINAYSGDELAIKLKKLYNNYLLLQ